MFAQCREPVKARHRQSCLQRNDGTVARAQTTLRRPALDDRVKPSADTSASHRPRRAACGHRCRAACRHERGWHQRASAVRGPSGRRPAGGEAAVSLARDTNTIKISRLQQKVDWYRAVVGVEVTFQNANNAWTTNDAANHRVAFLSVPGLSDDADKVRHTGMHHSAFEYASFADLVRCWCWWTARRCSSWRAAMSAISLTPRRWPAAWRWVSRHAARMPRRRPPPARR